MKMPERIRLRNNHAKRREEVHVVNGDAVITVSAPKGEAWPLGVRICNMLRRKPIPVFEMTDVELAQQYFEAP